MTAPPRRFVGWRIVLLSMIGIAMTGPGQTIGVSVFIDWFVRDLELSRTTISTAYLIGTVGGGLSMPQVGRAIDRYGVRRSIVVIGGLFSLAVAAMAGVNGVLWLTLGFFGIRLLGQGSLSLASTVAVAHWFEQRRGLAVGLTMTVGGALMALVPVGLNQVIEAIGWRAAWLVAATAVFVVVVPMGWFGFVDRPADVGQQVDGATTTATGSGTAPARSVTSSEAIRTRKFWVIAAATSATSMLITAFNFHQIALLGEAGLTAAVAAVMFLPQVLGTAGAGILTGVAADRLGMRFIPAASMVLLLGAQLLGASVDGEWRAVVYAIALGATGGTVRTMSGTLLPAWFGTRYLGSIQGSLTLISVIASALGPLGLALARQGLGSYSSALLWSALLSASALAFSLTLRGSGFTNPSGRTERVTSH